MLHQQIIEYFESFLSKFQCGFRQGFSALKVVYYGAT